VKSTLADRLLALLSGDGLDVITTKDVGRSALGASRPVPAVHQLNSSDLSGTFVARRTQLEWMVGKVLQNSS
jgi:hypothetical protein